VTANILAVDVPEAARRLGLSPRTVANLVARKELTSRKIGRRRIIPVVALEAFIRSDGASGRVRQTKAVQEGRSTR